MTKRRWLRALLLVLLLALSVPAVFLFRVYRPSRQDLQLPPESFAISSAEGRAMLARSSSADLPALQRSYEPQRHGSFCGIASSVIAVRALGERGVTQSSIFDARTESVQTWSQAFFGGVTLDELGAFLAAHGMRTVVVHAEPGAEEAFRAAVRVNMARATDVLLVNYDRRVVGEEGGGHVSPIGAYDPEDDAVLVMDTAAYKYPAHWVPLPSLYRAMATIDSDGGARRGYVEVARRP